MAQSSDAGRGSGHDETRHAHCVSWRPTPAQRVLVLPGQSVLAEVGNAAYSLTIFTAARLCLFALAHAPRRLGWGDRVLLELQYGSVRASLQRHENTLPSSHPRRTGTGVKSPRRWDGPRSCRHGFAPRGISGDNIGTRVSGLARRIPPAIPRDTTLGPLRKRDSLPSPPSLLRRGRRHAVRAVGGMRTSAVHSDVLCLHGGSFRSYAVRTCGVGVGVAVSGRGRRRRNATGFRRRWTTRRGVCLSSRARFGE